MTTNPFRPVDVYVGGRLRLRRRLFGLSQSKIAARVGLTFQQIQKYERGANRIGASRLYEFCQILECPVSYFFAGYGHGLPSKISLMDKNTLDVARNYAAISDPKRQLAAYRLIKAMATPEATPAAARKPGRQVAALSQDARAAA